MRADVIDDKTVSAIEFTAYEAMANEKAAEIREEIIVKIRFVVCAYPPFTWRDKVR